MTKIIKAEFNGTAMQFNADGWFNATLAAERFGKSPYEWLRLPDTERYLSALEKRTTGKIPYVKASRARADRGGGTWLHPKLAVRFAQWLDVEFAIWCDEQVDALIRGSAGPDSWQAARHDAGARFRGVCDLVKLVRMADGKDVAQHHYANEARLINLALTGSIAKVDRNALNKPELRLLELVEAQDMVLLGRGVPYEERKRALMVFANEQRQRLALPANDAGRASA